MARKSKHSEEQIAAILKEVDGGKSVAEVAKAHKIPAPTIYIWKRKRSGGSSGKRTKAKGKRGRAAKGSTQSVAQLLEENRTLKLMLADYYIEKFKAGQT